MRPRSDSKAERQLILLSAGTAARRRSARGDAARLAPAVDWPRLTATLYSRRLLPLLGPRILDLLDEDPARADFAAAVARARDAGRRQGQLLQLVTLRLLELLAAAGIPAAALKGPLLGEAIHGDPGRRLSSDLDLLVAPHRLADAVAVVRQLGYGEPIDHLLPDGLPLLHLRMLDHRRKLPPLELHWRVHWYERRFAADRLLPPTAGVWLAPNATGAATPAATVRAVPAATASTPAAAPAAGGPAPGWRPAPADELASLLLFYARDGFIDLRIATDISAWWDARGGELPAEGLAGVVDAYPQLARVLPAAARVAENIVGLPAARLLRDARRPGVRGRLAAKVANPNPQTSQPQLYADMGLVDGLLAPPGGLRDFVARQLLPPAEVLDQQARHGERHGTRAVPVRFLGVLGRYGLTLTRRGLRRAPAAGA